MSGQRLALALGVTRTRVWQLVGELRELGYPISAEAGRGYCWESPFGLLDADSIAASLPPGWSVTVDWSVSSTNDAVNRGRSDRVVRFAEHQTAGRGRVGRYWASQPGGLHLSAGRSYAGLARGPRLLSPYVALRLATELWRQGVTDVAVKWPNDLLCGEAKLGGVLIEITGDPYGACHVCVGVGVNWDRPVLTDQEATGLVPWLAGPDRNAVAGCLAGTLAGALDDYPQLEAGRLVSEWRRFDALYGSEVTLHHGAERIFGRADGIDDDGAFRLITGGGVSRFTAGEARLRRR